MLPEAVVATRLLLVEALKVSEVSILPFFFRFSALLFQILTTNYFGTSRDTLTIPISWKSPSLSMKKKIGAHELYRDCKILMDEAKKGKCWLGLLRSFEISTMWDNYN